MLIIINIREQMKKSKQIFEKFSNNYQY